MILFMFAFLIIWMFYVPKEDRILKKTNPKLYDMLIEDRKKEKQKQKAKYFKKFQKELYRPYSCRGTFYYGSLNTNFFNKFF